MTRHQYLSEVIRLYLEAPGTPCKPKRRDWAIAGHLYQRGVSLSQLAHAIRIATLRRHLTGAQRQPPIHSLAYYRAVLEGLTEDDLDADYVLYVQRRLQLSKDTGHDETAARQP